MKKIKKVVLLVIYIIIAITVIFNMNGFIGKMANKENPIIKLDDFNLKEYAKDTVYYGFYEFKIYNNLFENTVLTMWAFCETEFNNTNRKGYMILSSDKDTYLISCGNTPRPDILELYKNKKIPSINIGINADFSPVGIKNGTYRLYVAIKENEHNYGVVKTKYLFSKNEQGLKKVYYTIDELPHQIPNKISKRKISSWKGNKIDYEIYAADVYDDDSGNPLLVISGASKCFSPISNKNRWMSVILVDEKNAYEFGVATVSNSEITNYEPVFLKDVNGEYGFYCKFRADTIPNGTYQIYLRNVENDQYYGLEDASLKLVKEDSNVHFAN